MTAHVPTTMKGQKQLPIIWDCVEQLEIEHPPLCIAFRRVKEKICDSCKLNDRMASFLILRGNIRVETKRGREEMVYGFADAQGIAINGDLVCASDKLYRATELVRSSDDRYRKYGSTDDFFKTLEDGLSYMVLLEETIERGLLHLKDHQKLLKNPSSALEGQSGERFGPKSKIEKRYIIRASDECHQRCFRGPVELRQIEILPETGENVDLLNGFSRTLIWRELQSHMTCQTDEADCKKSLDSKKREPDSRSPLGSTESIRKKKSKRYEGDSSSVNAGSTAVTSTEGEDQMCTTSISSDPQKEDKNAKGIVKELDTTCSSVWDQEKKCKENDVNFGKGIEAALLLEIKNHGLKQTLANKEAVIRAITSKNEALCKELAGCNPKKRLQYISIVNKEGAKLCISKNDYDAVADILLTNAGLREEMIQEKILDLIKLRRDDESSKLSSLSPSIGDLTNVTHLNLWSSNIKSLSLSIGKLHELERLNLRSSNITSLPTSIGKLQNLKEMDLSFTLKLKNLPEEIGYLSSLNKLMLSYSKIRSLPTSIGKLQNLKEISLSDTSQLENLPDEIGDLSSLNKLDLRSSKIRSLPTSIGKLQNLKEMYLSCTSQLENLPDEIGNLSSLNKLILRDSNITSLPTSIGKLQNLKEISLSDTSQLENLPDEIGDLSSLNKLNLCDSEVSTLPPSVNGLHNLRQFDLPYKVADGDDANDFVANLMENLPFLGSVSPLYEGDNHSGSFRYTLACNRAKFRMQLSDKKFTHTSWPLLLHNGARQLFRSYCNGDIQSSYDIEQPDAIHYLLLVERHSFVCLLTNCTQKTFKHD